MSSVLTDGKTRGADGKAGHADGKAGGADAKASGADAKDGGADAKTGGADGKAGGANGKAGGADADLASIVSTPVTLTTMSAATDVVAGHGEYDSIGFEQYIWNLELGSAKVMRMTWPSGKGGCAHPQTCRSSHNTEPFIRYVVACSKCGYRSGEITYPPSE